MPLLIRLLLIIAASYLVLVVLMYTMQSSLVHLPHIPGRGLTATPGDIGLDFQSVELEAADGVRLHGWFVAAGNARGTLLFFHGNAGNISHRLDSLRIFNALGVNTLIIDYRGYGQSQGSPSEQGLYRDAEAAYRHLVDTRDIPPERVIAFGRSLGAAVAAWTAAQHRLGGLILESAFVSVPELGAELYPWLPVRHLSRLRYDTRAHLRGIDLPVLIVHSEDDEIIPYAHALTLREAAGSSSDLLTIRGDHNTGFLQAGAEYREGLARFLSAVLPDQQPGVASEHPSNQQPDHHEE
ncbi:MAG: alpha/beta hydrolase [Aquisalimonadaceae bacterium]